jgi:hypothetical protein
MILLWLYITAREAEKCNHIWCPEKKRKENMLVKNF